MQEVSHNRRAVLALGGTAVLVALTGGVLHAVDAAAPPNSDTFSPWRLWDAPDIRGKPMALVAAAVLAANPHNTQPWLFKVSEDAIEIYADPLRHLGAMDPFLREMHLGLGCAIENAVLTAGPNVFTCSQPILASRCNRSISPSR
jgi:hypothetical protein